MQQLQVREKVVGFGRRLEQVNDKRSNSIQVSELAQLSQ